MILFFHYFRENIFGTPLSMLWYPMFSSFFVVPIQLTNTLPLCKMVKWIPETTNWSLTCYDIASVQCNWNLLWCNKLLVTIGQFLHKPVNCFFTIIPISITCTVCLKWDFHLFLLSQLRCSINLSGVQWSSPPTLYLFDPLWKT